MSAGPVLAHGGGGSFAVPLPAPLWLLLVVGAAAAAAGVLRRRGSDGARRGPLTSGALRVGRGLLVAGASVGMSLSGHVLAGAPPALTADLLAAVVVLAVGCCAASRVRWTFPRLLAVTGTAEPGLHVLFELSRADGTAPPSLVAAGTGLLTDPGMLAAHAAAAVVLAAVLAHGEAVAFSVVAALAAALTRWTAPARSGPVLLGPARHRCSEVRSTVRPSSVLLVSAPRRGPPQGISVR